MKLNMFVQLCLQALCPVALTVIFCLISKFTKLNFLPEKNRDFYTKKNTRNLRYYIFQVIVGVAFGLVCMSCNVWNIKLGNAIINVRDASPITAGLLFGGPSGVIAGLMGGIHRYFLGGYTQIACSVSTCIAGIYAALLRWFLFDDHKPNWSLSCVTGVVMEVFHLSMVFITHPNDLANAGNIVKQCSLPLITCTAVSVLLSRIIYSFLTKERIFTAKKKSHISNIFQRKLFLVVGVGFLVTTLLLILVQFGIARDTAAKQLLLENESINETYHALYPNEKYLDRLLHYETICEAAGLSNDGEAMVATYNGNILNGSLKGKNIYDLLALNKQYTIPDEMQKISVDGEKYLLIVRDYADVTIITEFHESLALYTSEVSIYVNVYLQVFVFSSIFIVAFIIIKKTVTDNISVVNRHLNEISNGYLDTVVNVNDNLEFQALSRGINHTVDSLKGYIDAEKKRIDSDLAMAHSIQESALPNVFPAFVTHKEFDIYASMTPAKEVGGDFYDFYLIDRNRLAFLVADVSGKGIPAAMFMMRAKSILKSLTLQSLSMGEIFTQSNASLCEGNDNSMFVTAWESTINLDTGEFAFANAGHNPPLIRHLDGTFEYLRSKVGLVLAGMDGINYKSLSGSLKPGEMIFLYTDGVTESTNEYKELYGEDRLLNFANSCEFTDMKDFCEKVKADIDKFVGNAPQFDDITMLAFKYIGFKAMKINKDIAKIEDISEITEKTEAFLDEIDAPMRAKMQILVAIDELYSNIAKFSYGESGGPAEFKIEELRDRDGICMTFTDSGIPYNPIMKEDPNIHLSAEERQIGGLGIYMTKKTMDDLSYEFNNNRNILKVTKYFA